MAKTKTPPVFKTFFIDDEGHNKLIMKRTEKTKTLYLQLQSYTRKRRLGVVTISTRTITVRRKYYQHLFRKGNAYGFNEFLLKNTKTFDTINLSDEFSDWKIPVKFILENGKHLNFKQQGFELQLFVSLEQIEQFKVKKEDRL